MPILAKSEILREVSAGRIRITPWDERMVGPASVDLHLSDSFRVFVHLPTTLDVTEELDFRSATKGFRVPPGDSLVLQPGQTVLGITQERVELPPDICGWLEGRSRFARVGMLVHVSSSFMQPGISNHQVLEMSNFGPIALRIRPGTAVCQFIFQRVVGDGRYQGIFRGQDPDAFLRD
ncbi:MAG: dCTP deaminase [Deltaproteobacteria bacterium]|nr:dCTP deaminase [Deltaproteobacteria bacterium]